MPNTRQTIVHRDQPGLHYAIPVEQFDQPQARDGKTWRERGFQFQDPALRKEHGAGKTVPARLRPTPEEEPSA